MHYFEEVTKNEPKGVIKVSRVSIPAEETVQSIIDESFAMLTEVVLIEDGDVASIPGATITNFANMYLGGGCMQQGAVQEEILFLEFPELFAARMVSPCMEFNEAICIHGVQRFSIHENYGYECKYSGPFKDSLAESVVNDTDCIDRTISSIDAICFYMQTELKQLEREYLDREIRKAMAGFKEGKNPIATGRWGCGAFNGCAQVKFIIQWIAAS